MSPATAEGRKFERKRVPLSAKMTDITGKVVLDCTIRDLSPVGAQVSLPTVEPIPATVYLIEVTGRIAYKANVAWWRPQSVGLAFQETHELDQELPSRPEFLKRVWMEAKLEQVDALMANGRALSDAVQMVGLTGTDYARLNSERAHDDDLMRRLWKLETENLALRKLLAEMTGKSNAPQQDLSDPLPAKRPLAS
jgi:hypothetical protein